ncbi:EamA-like transporter family protein [Yoonia sediminilitoris]|uniref:EamA-like transporter family protein n=2 Tax=Yoonia sediminilitoris TaxID=1286148 RepID=A0A2T6K865_9RHOB|nr:EamA-like transporter family protein [Yoonia sediminilitoris]RCW90550.1 EamA-like transporter family protein [Yoonia sediminilitoris]
MLLFSLLVAGSFALGALAANDITPLALNTVRFWFAVVVMGVVVAMTSGFSRQAAAAPWRYVILAVFFVTYFVLMFEGLKTAPPVSAAAVFTLTPILTAGFGYLLLRQMLTPRMGFALAIGAVGAVWVIFRADIAAILRFEIGKGEWIYFWGCVGHAVYTPLVRKLNRGEPAVVFSFGVLLAGAIMLTAVGWSDLQQTVWRDLPPIVWITIGYTAVFASAATFTLLQFATLRLPSSKVMAYTYLTPSWVILWDVALGGAVPPMLVFLGVGLTMVALVLLLRDEG